MNNLIFYVGVFLIIALLYPCSKPPTCSTTCNSACLLFEKTLVSQRKSSSWNTYYPSVVELLKDAENVVEVGTAWGGLADALLTGLPKVTVRSIDPFLPHYDPADVQAQIIANLAKDLNLTATEMSLVWAQTMRYNLISKHGCRYQLLHQKSTSACRALPTGFADAIFIDGLHTYDGVKSDISSCAHVVRKGGKLIFNDFNNGSFPGVVAAVTEFASMRALKIHPMGFDNIYMIA